MSQEFKGYRLKIPVEFFQEGKAIIAYCPILDLSTSGSTLANAQRNFREAVDLWVESCIEMGTLDQALQELGWTKKKTDNNVRMVPPRVLRRTSESVCIPA